MNVPKSILTMLIVAAMWLSGCTPKKTAATREPVALETLRAEECISDAWTYSSYKQTDIDIAPDLIITIVRSTTRCPGGCAPYTATIYGNGQLIYSEYLSGTVSTKIPIDHLQQIVTAFEEANFYAVAPGCGETKVSVSDAGHLNISVATEKLIYEIEDEGACAASYFWRFCGLADKVERILGLP